MDFNRKAEMIKNQILGKRLPDFKVKVIYNDMRDQNMKTDEKKNVDDHKRGEMFYVAAVDSRRSRSRKDNLRI